ncbi:hypothetical protein [Flavobacterium sp. UGB4466]|uniref:hypothetical protein n=1 Tax=Flavobacterium sp. UGB4466 TaxID=2730889 RepID=UPI00192B2E33|nr:hypothetical protein [Flavobacterium sp. UGB4466]
MSYRLLFISILLMLYGASYSQVGIGNSKPDNSAMLDIVSTNKGVVIPRIALTGSNDLTTISNGNVESLLIYNTATVSDITPGYYYWSKNKWNKIATTDDTLSLTAGNGLTFSNGKLQLGGALETPTTLTTTAINTLAINGLEAGDLKTDEIVVVDKTNGTLKKVPKDSFLQQKQELYIAKEGQEEFTTVSPINDPQKVNVYRNGIRVDFSIVKPGTIKLESGAICYQNDEIRIVLVY